MDQLNQLISKLVSINSINPDLVPGAPGEAEIAHFVAGWLENAGLEVHLEEPVPGRPNVIGLARGTGGGKTLMLNGHLDTVGTGGMAQPHQPQLKNGCLYGRGSYDMKGGLAACMLAAGETLKEHLRGDVVFTGVMDEEFAGLGTLSIAQHYHADAAIIAESTELNLIPVHKGFVWLEIETLGIAAHGSRPELGVDAIAKMGYVLTSLAQLDQNLRAHPIHPRLGSGSLHASLIQGGQELSTYPQRCLLSVERRTIPGETAESVEAELQMILEQISRTDPSFKAVVRRGLDRAPLETPEDAEIVQALNQSAAQVLGKAPAIAGVPYWTDAATLFAVGIPSVLFGPTGAGAHATEEWVDLQSVQVCVDVYRTTAIQFCQ